MNDIKFQFGNVVVVDNDCVGVIVKTWGATDNRQTHYDVYVRYYNAIREYDQDQIKHYVYSKELLDEQHVFYSDL